MIKERKYIRTNSQTKEARFVRNRGKRVCDVLLVSWFVWEILVTYLFLVSILVYGRLKSLGQKGFKT